MPVPRHTSYGNNDDKPLLDGDVAFSRMNMAVEPDLLAQGEYSFARNIRVRRGKPTTRRGMVRLPWADTANATPVYGSCSFCSPAKVPYILKARADHCEACDPVGGINIIRYPEGVTIDDECELVQMFDRVLMLRGDARPSLEWRTPVDWLNPFGSAFGGVEYEALSGTQPIPNAPWAINFKNRAIVPLGRDELIASDILNYTRYDPVRAQFMINKGDSQSVRGAISGGRESLVVFKENKGFLIENFRGDLSAVTMDELPMDVGLGARRTLCGYGSEIFFLSSDLGLHTLAQALDNRLQGEEKAFSDPVEPMMESIRSTLLHKCVARIWNKALYLAIPVGPETETANVILVHDFTGAGGWSSIDTSSLYEIQNLIVHPINGRQRLCMVHESGAVYVMEEGWDDAGEAIATDFVSRGYTCGQEGRKAFSRGEVVLSTWDPEYSIESSANGGAV